MFPHSFTPPFVRSVNPLFVSLLFIVSSFIRLYVRALFPLLVYSFVCLQTGRNVTYLSTAFSHEQSLYSPCPCCHPRAQTDTLHIRLIRSYSDRCSLAIPPLLQSSLGIQLTDNNSSHIALTCSYRTILKLRPFGRATMESFTRTFEPKTRFLYVQEYNRVLDG